MISTLIRGKSKVGTPPPIGNNEYLVDTESNRVIYPYTLIDNIIGRDENGELVNPSSSPSIGIGKLDYKYEIKEVPITTNVKIFTCDTNIVLDKGLWTVNGSITYYTTVMGYNWIGVHIKDSAGIMTCSNNHISGGSNWCSVFGLLPNTEEENRLSIYMSSVETSYLTNKVIYRILATRIGDI